MLANTKMEPVLLTMALLLSQASGFAVKYLSAAPTARMSIQVNEAKPTPAPIKEFLRRQNDFEVPEVTANPATPTFQGWQDGDPNSPMTCSPGSTAFLQDSGGFACCQGNCGSYTAPTTCYQGGNYAGPHTFGLTTNCADAAASMCNYIYYPFSTGTWQFAFCSDNDVATTITVLDSTTDDFTPIIVPSTTTNSYTPPDTTFTPDTTLTPFTTTTSSDPTTSTPTTTSSEPFTTSSFPNTDTSSSTSSSNPIIPITSSTGPVNTPTPAPAPASGSKTNVGAIAGGVAGGVGGALLIVGTILFVFFRRKKNNDKGPYSPELYPRAQTPPNNDPPPSLPPPSLGSPSPGIGSFNEKLQGNSSVQPLGSASASPAMSQNQTASPSISTGFPTYSSGTSELQGTSSANYRNAGAQGSWEVHELPATSHKALPTTSPLYHELGS